MRLGFLILLALLLAGCRYGPTDRPYNIESEYGVADPQFGRTMGNLLGPALVGGNKTTTLLNGDQIFPAMLQAVRSAKKTITFETFVYWSGEIGQEFSVEISER